MPFNIEGINRQIRSLSDFMTKRSETQSDLQTALKKAYITKQVEMAFPDPLKQLKDELELMKVGEEITGLKRKTGQEKGSMDELMRQGLVLPNREFLRENIEAPTPVTRPFRPGARTVTAGETRAFAEGMPFVKPEELQRRYQTDIVQPTRARTEAMGLRAEMPEYGKIKKELTPYQQQQREEAKNRADAWLAGTPFKDIEPPETKEQAYWGLKSFGEDPDEYDLSEFLSQEEVYGKPAGGGKGAAKGIMRIFPGYTRKGAFMASIPESRAENKTRYKVGETKVIDGITYKRNEKGEWLPQ